jgi:hypothetical protein
LMDRYSLGCVVTGFLLKANRWYGKILYHDFSHDFMEHNSPSQNGPFGCPRRVTGHAAVFSNMRRSQINDSRSS